MYTDLVISTSWFLLIFFLLFIDIERNLPTGWIGEPDSYLFGNGARQHAIPSANDVPLIVRLGAIQILQPILGEHCDLADA